MFRTPVNYETVLKGNRKKWIDKRYGGTLGLGSGLHSSVTAQLLRVMKRIIHVSNRTDAMLSIFVSARFFFLFKINRWLPSFFVKLTLHS